MIVCPVCTVENDAYAMVCKSCRAYLQNRIPNIDFFSTAWKVLESPQQAFREIVLAEHKNYALGLYAFFGIAVAFTCLWFFKAGEYFEYLLYILFAGLFGGIFLGLAMAPVVSGIHLVLSKIIARNATFRNSLGTTAYSFVPVLLSLIVVLPIELLTFGLYLFSNNPDPYTIKPLEYSILVGADVALALWTAGLAILGTRVGLQTSAIRAAAIILMTMGICAGILFAGGTALRTVLVR